MRRWQDREARSLHTQRYAGRVGRNRDDAHIDARAMVTILSLESVSMTATERGLVVIDRTPQGDPRQRRLTLSSRCQLMLHILRPPPVAWPVAWWSVAV